MVLGSSGPANSTWPVFQTPFTHAISFWQIVFVAPARMSSTYGPTAPTGRDSVHLATCSSDLLL
eukprot:281699-Amphidinium_carterae.1